MQLETGDKGVTGRLVVAEADSEESLENFVVKYQGNGVWRIR